VRPDIVVLMPMVILSFDEMVNDGFDLMKRDRDSLRSRSAGVPA
jgi:hypothetical protein